MAKHSSHILAFARRGAALRLRELVNELNLLLVSFPDLRDAFDPDELPVSYIVARDGRRAAARAAAQRTPPAARKAKKTPAR
jgi:hypothetical protein